MDNKERVLQVIIDKTGLAMEDLRDDAKFEEDLGCDSLDLIEVVLGLENEFGISIKDDQYDKVETVADLVNLVNSYD